MHAWLGHPNLQIFRNTGTFEQKICELENAVARVVGLPASMQPTRRFLLREPPVLPPDVHVETFHVEKIYLKIQVESDRVIPLNC